MIICSKCGQKKVSKWEPGNAWSGGFYIFGCDCDDMDGYGYGITPKAAEEDYIKNSMKACSQCGRQFEPRWLAKLNRYSSVCSRCAILALASLVEEPAPHDSLKDIHDGEQMGALLRDAAQGKNNRE